MMTGSPPTVMTMGVLPSWAIFFTFMPVSVRVGPMMATTLSLWMNLVAMLAALAGSPSVSATISSIFLPPMPPSALIFSTSISATSLLGVPMKDARPDRSKNPPSLMVSSARAGAASSMRPARSPMILRMSSLLWKMVVAVVGTP